MLVPLGRRIFRVDTVFVDEITQLLNLGEAK